MNFEISLLAFLCLTALLILYSTHVTNLRVNDLELNVGRSYIFNDPNFLFILNVANVH